MYYFLLWNKSNNQLGALQCNCVAVFGDSLGAFRDSVFCELAGHEETDGSLDFARGNGGFGIVTREPTRFNHNPFEKVRDESIHDFHGFGGNACGGGDLFENLVNIARITRVRRLFGSFFSDSCGGRCNFNHYGVACVLRTTRNNDLSRGNAATYLGMYIHT